jgi:hypothetical protein
VEGHLTALPESREDAAVLARRLGKYADLPESTREALWEHYRRCDQFWRHWTPTIWSMPSVASAINVGAYAFIQEKGAYRLAVLGVVSLLNLTVAFGLWKHRYMQRTFGARMLDIERYAGIPIIEFSRVHRRISGSWVYVLTMLLLTALSISLFVAAAL